MTRRTRPTLGVLAAALAAAVLLPGSSALAPPAVFAAARVALVARVAPSAPTVAGFSIRVDGDSAVHLGPLASAPPAEPVRRPIDPSPAGGSDSGAWPLVVLAAIVVGSLGGVALTRRLEGRHARRSLARSDRYLDRGGTPDGEAWVSRALARRPSRARHTRRTGRPGYSRRVKLPFDPPLEPMLARLADLMPGGDGWQYEPKWDGFRALVFRDGDEVLIQSRDLRPLDRYFPELPPALRANIPDRCVLDGEVVIAGQKGLDFDSLLLRIHPAASRVKLLAEQTPASYVAWDLLALGDEDLRTVPQGERRERLVAQLLPAVAPIHLTPATRDAAVATDWFGRFEGAGLDGVVAKRLDEPYLPGKRAWTKVKHARTADCVVAGFRWYKNGNQTMVGSLLLGLFDDAGRLHHVGVTSSFTADYRHRLLDEIAPLRENALEGHPWAEWAEWERQAEASGQRMPGATSRWNRGKDLSWEPLRPERVCEVAYDHLQGDRFRHATTFVRWRPDKPPEACRYDQLETTAPYELESIFGR